MDLMDAIKGRFSARSYESTAVEEEKLQAVLEAARLAPSANNMQEWHFVVVRDAALRSKLVMAAHNQAFVAQAPVVIALCASNCEKVMSCGQYAYPIDLAIAGSYLQLAATSLGLATCWLGAFDERAVKILLNVPDDIRVPILFTLGYSARQAPIKVRKPLAEIVLYDSYGG